MRAPRAQQIDAMADTILDRWSAGSRAAEDVVAMFAALHTAVYGVSCAAELARKEWPRAVARAEQLVQRLGGVEAAGEFVRWLWGREQNREQWRRSNRRGGGRLTWRYATTDTNLAAYRAWRARRRSP